MVGLNYLILVPVQILVSLTLSASFEIKVFIHSWPCFKMFSMEKVKIRFRSHVVSELLYWCYINLANVWWCHCNSPASAPCPGHLSSAQATCSTEREKRPTGPEGKLSPIHALQTGGQTNGIRNAQLPQKADTYMYHDAYIHVIQTVSLKNFLSC